MINIKKPMILNEKAMTISELIVGIGVLSISLAIIASTQFTINEEMRKADEIIQGKIENLSGEKQILFDIQAGNVSFNNLLIKDDAGMIFFDYIPEKPVNLILTEPDRKINLSASKAGAVKEIVLLVQDAKLGGILIYDPTAAYDIGVSNNNFNIPAPLTFVGLNKDNRITNQRPLFWSEGQLLFLDTTSRIRPSINAINMDEAPVSPIFLGQVQSSSLIKLTLNDILIRDIHPETKAQITTADNFLRTIPAYGGGVSTVRIQAVKLIKYYLAQSNKSIGLFKATYNAKDKNWEQGILIADEIDNVLFQRQSVSSKIIQFKINKIDKVIKK